MTPEDMAQLPTHSREWFAAALEGMAIPDHIKTVAAYIAKVYDIRGQADPGHIAHMIDLYMRRKPTPCKVSATGEHYNHSEGLCVWCWDISGGETDMNADENARLRARCQAAESALRLLSDEMSYVLATPLTAGDLARARGVLLAARRALDDTDTAWAPHQGGDLPDNSGQGDSAPRTPR